MEVSVRYAEETKKTTFKMYNKIYCHNIRFTSIVKPKDTITQLDVEIKVFLMVDKIRFKLCKQIEYITTFNMAAIRRRKEPKGPAKTIWMDVP